VPTAFFHAHTNARRRHNHISSLWHGDQTLLSKEEKTKAVFNFFNEVLATPPSLSRCIKFEELGLPSLDMSPLGMQFTEEEVWSVIKGLELDKAPSPDGFTARFLQVAWLVIRHDLMSAFNVF
jgi:hypothetical protein